MTPSLLRMATRKSPLALKQSRQVGEVLKKYYPALKIVLIPLSTTGDKFLTEPLAAIGGKGLFIKELEQALLENKADIAVHSMKDMPAAMTPGLEISAVLERDDPRDVLVSNQYHTLKEIPSGSKIGTASLRRQGMVKCFREDLRVETLRGNINTRLSKLDHHEYDAIILAAAGLHRLGLGSRIKTYFSPAESLPAVGQGIIGIQSCTDNKHIKKLLLPLEYFPSRVCLRAERALNQHLEGSCHSPIGGYAALQNHQIHLRGCVYGLGDPKICLKAEHIFTLYEETFESAGKKVAEKLFAQGAKEILAY